MKWVRDHKLFGAHAVWVVLLPLMVFSLALPCHGEICQDNCCPTLGTEICDCDSPCLSVNAEDLGFMAAMSSHSPIPGSTIPQIFVHSIFHPPRA